MEYARNLITELFAPYEESHSNFFDNQVCKHYLVEFCPNSLVVNTKGDIGACLKLHNERLKKQYQESDKQKYRYEQQFYDYLKEVISDLERKIKRGRERLDLKPADARTDGGEQQEERTIWLEVKIKELTEKMEEFGEQGLVKEAQDLNTQVEGLQLELHNIKNKVVSLNQTGTDKLMEVCDVCGAFLIVNDTSGRLATHIEGKQHQGYKKIREAYQQRKEKMERKPLPPVRNEHRQRPIIRRDFEERDQKKDDGDFKRRGDARPERNGRNDRGDRKDDSRRNDRRGSRDDRRNEPYRRRSRERTRRDR